MLHINNQPRVLFHAGIASLQPMIKPAHRFIAPLDLRTRHGIVRKRMVPGSNDRLNRSRWPASACRARCRDSHRAIRRSGNWGS
jgi:hypothetical protein